MPDAVDSAIAEIAARQHGNITRRQLLDLGLGAQAIRYRVRTSRLHRIFTGVYAVGHRPLSPIARAAAAVLACGNTAALSHGSAATLWGIDARWHQPLEVTARSAHQHRGVKAHRSRTLSAAHVTKHFAITVTTPERTVFDLAGRYTDAKLARAVNEARRSGYLKLPALAQLLYGFPSHRATKRLKPFIEIQGHTAPTRSGFEDDFLKFTERYGLPRPETNVKIGGREVDALFREHKLIVELDSWEFHNDRDSFEDDRDRDVDALVARFETVRVTWERFTTEPDREAARLQSILEARQSLW
jgi:hypothetical protein